MPQITSTRGLRLTLRDVSAKRQPDRVVDAGTGLPDLSDASCSATATGDNKAALARLRRPLRSYGTPRRFNGNIY